MSTKPKDVSELSAALQYILLKTPQIGGFRSEKQTKRERFTFCTWSCINREIQVSCVHSTYSMFTAHQHLWRWLINTSHFYQCARIFLDWKQWLPGELFEVAGQPVEIRSIFLSNLLRIKYAHSQTISFRTLKYFSNTVKYLICFKIKSHKYLWSPPLLCLY